MCVVHIVIYARLLRTGLSRQKQTNDVFSLIHGLKDHRLMKEDEKEHSAIRVYSLPPCNIDSRISLL